MFLTFSDPNYVSQVWNSDENHGVSPHIQIHGIYCNILKWIPPSCVGANLQMYIIVKCMLSIIHFKIAF